MASFGTSEWRTTNADKASHFSDELLVLEAQAGEEWAFVELCFRHSRRVIFMLSKITRNREDAEDVFQESILKAFVHLGNFNRASSFSTWLTRISINSALMMLRRKRGRPEVSIDGPIDQDVKPVLWELADRRPNPEEQLIESESRERLQFAISRLPTSYRTVVEIRCRSDASLKEIAEETGITVAATKSRLLRGRNALRKSV
jgi:RNA polymerase sigma factor (sigma-70 family)